jgi:tRNA(His) 5'-end guanylyltransferase
MKKLDLLGARMKKYEHTFRTHLMRRQPVVIRIDGKAFHTFTRGMKKPFDAVLSLTMWETTQYLCQNIQGCKLGYTQSDEISLLLTDYEKLNTDAWFDYNVQKMTSISASMATLAFNQFFQKNVNELVIGNIDYDASKYVGKVALFDSRVVALPKEEVVNYFIWRQQDASKNSVSMVAQANFSHKELQNKNTGEMQEMLFSQKGINWNDIIVPYKRGLCTVKKTIQKTVETKNGPQEYMRREWVMDRDIPIFTQDRAYIECYV